MYTIILGTDSGQRLSQREQDWRDVLSGALPVAWANLFNGDYLAASWDRGLLSVVDATTTNGLDPIPE